MLLAQSCQNAEAHQLLGRWNVNVFAFAIVDVLDNRISHLLRWMSIVLCVLSLFSSQDTVPADTRKLAPSVS